MDEHFLDLIAINCRTGSNCSHDDRIHFITHISRKSNKSVKLLPDGVSKVYTSKFNVWYLKTFLGISGDRLVSVKLEEETELEFKGEKFTFEFLDANHCPGSVMILLKGNVGQYLYTGNCRYKPEMLNSPSLRKFVNTSSPILDRMYVDGTYFCEDVNFPTRDEVIRDAVQLIDAHRGEKILICSRILGLERVLREIALQLNEKIFVSKSKYRVLRRLGWAAFFTNKSRESRIHTVDYKEVTPSKIITRRKSEGACIAIVMSALFLLWRKEKIKRYRSFGIYMIPYSDHNSSSETKTMVEELKAKKKFYLNRYPLIVNGFKCRDSTDVVELQEVEVVDMDAEDGASTVSGGENSRVNNKFVEGTSGNSVIQGGSKASNSTNSSEEQVAFNKQFTQRSQFDLWDLTGNFIDSCQNILESTNKS